MVNNNETISVAALEEVLKSARLVNRHPDTCQSARFPLKIPCDFSFQKTTIPWGQINMPIMELSVGTQAGSPLASFSGLVSVMGSTIPGSSIEFVSQKKKVSYFNFMPKPFPTANVVGTNFRSLMLLTLQDLVQGPSAPQTLLAIVSIPGVVTGVNAADPTNCAYAKPSPAAMADDTVIVYSKNLGNFEQNLMRVRMISMPTFTTCKGP